MKQDKTDLKDLLEKEQTRGREREIELQSHIVEQQKTMSQQLMLLKAPETKPAEQQQTTAPIQETDQHITTPQPVPNQAPLKKQGRNTKWCYGDREKKQHHDTPIQPAPTSTS